MKNSKRKAAAIAAVANYIKTREEAAISIQAQAHDFPDQAGDALIFPAAPLHLWGLSGRQHQMQLRNMMQLKAFHGAKRT